MQKVLMALLDKRRALKTEADAIGAAIDKAEGSITAEQTSRLAALHEDGAKIDADLTAFAASLPEDPEKAKAEAVAAAVAAAITATRDVDANIAATCHIGNQSAKASAFIKEGKSLADVQAAVTAGKADASGRELRTHADGGAPDGNAWDKTIERVNARFGKK
jgi:rhodanese-related sulfurtransferase